MSGIDLNAPIRYCGASLRHFRERESHITRRSKEHILLMVYEGILRFVEDGISYELHPGDYHIQRQGSLQEGREASESPRYLYVHFLGTWAEGDSVLPDSGTFSYAECKEQMEDLDTKAHNGATLTACTAVFCSLLETLYGEKKTSAASAIADYLAKHLTESVDLTDLTEVFHYSKNYIIRLMREAYGRTPIQYLTELRIKQAGRLLEASSLSMEEIAEECGYHDYAHFYKCFRKLTGKSPKEWRKNKQKYPVSTEYF